MSTKGISELISSFCLQTFATIKYGVRGVGFSTARKYTPFRGGIRTYESYVIEAPVLTSMPDGLARDPFFSPAHLRAGLRRIGVRRGICVRRIVSLVVSGLGRVVRGF